jgi:anti-sigma B factor antagonist
MDFPIERRGDTLVVGVPGPLVVHNRQELKERVLDQLDKGEKNFLIDFRQTEYIDSSGLGVLVSLSKKVREHQGELRITNLSYELKKLFELTKLDLLFPRYDEWDGGDGSAGRPAPHPPRPAGPLRAAAEAELPDVAPPI